MYDKAAKKDAEGRLFVYLQGDLFYGARLITRQARKPDSYAMIAAQPPVVRVTDPPHRLTCAYAPRLPADRFAFIVLLLILLRLVGWFNGEQNQQTSKGCGGGQRSE